MRLGFTLPKENDVVWSKEAIDRLIGQEIDFDGRPGTVVKAWAEDEGVYVTLDVPGMRVIPAPRLDVSVNPPVIDPSRPRWMVEEPVEDDARVCHRMPQAGQDMMARCPDCKHWIAIHDQTLGCIVCDYAVWKLLQEEC